MKFINVIFKFFKRLFTLEDGSFGKYKFGTIVMAKRYHNEEEFNKIEEGHKNGPFIILKDTGTKLICIGGTGTKPSPKISVHKTLELNPREYNLTKTTYFNTSKIKTLEYDSVIARMDILNNQDKYLLLKKINILINRKYYKNIVPRVDKVELEIGDIVKYNHINYLIIDVDEANYIVFPFTDKPNNSVKIDQKQYFIDFDNITNLNKNFKLILVDFVSNQKLLSILKQYNQYLKNKENQKIKQRGSIIKKDNFYFIYGEYKDKWLVFEIGSGNYKIKINNSEYYTNFLNYQEIDKNDESFECISLANDEELEEITLLRKNIKKKNTPKEKKKFDFNPGEIVITKSLAQEEYIIVETHKKCMYGININELNEGKVIYLDKNFVIKKGAISPDSYIKMGENKIMLKKKILQNS